MDVPGTLGRGQVIPLENYKRGAKVWIRHPEKVWISGELLDDVSFSVKSVKLRLDNDEREEVDYALSSMEQLPFLQNPKVLVGSDDLTELSFLHEPAVLYNLQFRFLNRHQIYTYCGIVLVAINPYADCSQIYGDEIIQVYRGAGKEVRRRDPHIYAVAEEAFYDLAEFGMNQSIIVSGESGAGKTVSAKYALRYFASIASSRKGTLGIESRVLASNPIMEAIGNAKTVRNDNSSRFGKYVQINFGHSFAITGAEMKTYLLEKSRIVYQSQNERNYHIFYQMCRSRDHPLLKEFHLAPCEMYKYTNQGGDSRIPGVDDHSEFLVTVQALSDLGFAANNIHSFFRTLVGIIMLGNVEFLAGDDSTAITQESQSELKRLCVEILEVSETELAMWLTNREIRTVGECVRKPLSSFEAARSRDALAKMLYAQIYDWVVTRINEALRGMENSTRSKSAFIGVLDIYGFETFDVNSFEQFCINYANEKLQQQFNQHVFKLEQEEYVREEIAWVRIEFSDNQPTINLIENVPGLISFLDEQCLMPRGSDQGWLTQISTDARLKMNAQLKFPRIKSTNFIIKHFAAEVSYETNGFMEKNKDSVNELLLKVVSNSQCPFLKEIVTPCSQKGRDGAPSKASSKKTVAGQFRNSLKELMTVLGSTRPHYVRCIKPNDSKETFYFEPKRAIQQLRACGVLETVRISAEGFPSRWAYKEFGARYRVLYPQSGVLWKDKPQEFAKLACEKHLQSEKFALGKTKIFFRTGQVAILERLRLEILARSAVIIQSIWKGYIARKRFVNMKKSAITCQRAIRGYLARRELRRRREEWAATLIQKHTRGFLSRLKYQQTRRAVLALQNHFRGRQARIFVKKMRYENAVLKIQCIWRGHLVRTKFQEDRKKIVKVQSFVRRWLAKRRLRALKIEARSVGHLQKLNTGLENKIIQLQQRLDTVTAEKNDLLPLTATVAMLETQIVQLRGTRDELAAATRRIHELEQEVENLETNCDVKEAEKSGLKTQLSEWESKTATMRIEHERVLAEMKEFIDIEACKSADFQMQLKTMENHLAEANIKRIQAEKEVVQMKEQLLANASLLASPAFSREGSMRKNTLTESNNETTSDNANVDDLSLILRQQKTISELRALNDKTTRDFEILYSVAGAKELFASLENRHAQRSFETLRIQELEQMNQRMREDLDRIINEKALRGAEKADIKPMVNRLFAENDRLREEAAGLRSLLSRSFDDSSNESPRPDSGHGSDTHSEIDSINIDSELCLERQVRQLKSMADQLTMDLISRNQDCDAYERRLAEVRPSDCSSAEDPRGVQSQIRYLACENMNLNAKLIRQAEDLKEARAKMNFGPVVPLGQTLDQTADTDIIRLETLSKESGEHSALLEVFNVPEFSRILIYDLKPRLARLLTKCFPSYLLLTAFRFQDHAKDEAALTGLFSTVHIMLKDRISNSSDLDILSMWLVNTWRLLNLLRQYSGENGEVVEGWGAENTEKQNSQKMQAFDMAPIREQLTSRVEECYQYLMKKAIEPVLTPKIVPGVLQHESSEELGPRQQLIRQDSKDSKRRGLEDLIDFMNFIHAKLSVYGADYVLLSQVFQQIVQWICALALNHMMFRKELCNFEKAIQIKHNVTEIQSWLSVKGLGEHRDRLEPLVQACHLLQSRKDESNLETLCGEMTNKLMPRQVVAILQHYTPGQDFEERAVDPEFLVIVQRKLNEREAAAGKLEESKNTLIMPGTYLCPFNTATYVHSDFAIETLSLPSCLYLNQVSRLL